MTINPNSSLDNTTALDAQKIAQQRSANNANSGSSSANTESPAAEALSAFSMDETDTEGGVDSAGADQLMQGLVQAMGGNFGAAVGAHTGLNSTSVLQLLQ